jgi:outer membrane protein TolC
MKLSNLFKKSSLIWSIGPASDIAILGSSSSLPISQTLIDFGAIASLNDLAWSKYNESVHNYQQTVLNAFQEVEDGLVAMHRLSEENKTQSRATDFAYKTAQQSIYRHNAGLVTYLEVASTLEAAYQFEVSTINIRTRHLVASVQLIRALGGGWNVDDIKPLDIEIKLL